MQYLLFRAPRLIPIGGRGHVNRFVVYKSDRTDAGGDDGEQVSGLDPRPRRREGVWVDELEVVELDVLEFAARAGDHRLRISLAGGDRLGGGSERPVKGRRPSPIRRRQALVAA